MEQNQKVRRICPQCGMVLDGENWKVCPHCGRSLTAEAPEARAAPTRQDEIRGSVAAGIIALIALTVGWFAFGIICAIIAIGAGAYALKGKGSTAKSLGYLGIIGGAIEFIFSLIAIFAA